MLKPPANLDEAKVLYYTSIDERHMPTGATQHWVADELLGSAAGLAICQYNKDDAFYLFYCDRAWNVITDTCHQSLEDAFDQAELEYQGVSQTWEQM